MSTKAERNAENRTIREAASEMIRSRVAWIENQRNTFERYIGRFEVLLAVDLDRGASAVEALPRSDWRKWAAELLPSLDEKSIYRHRNAGRVATILAGDGTAERPNLLGEIPAASIGHLVPFYRVLPKGKAATEEAVSAAEALIRSTWAALVADLDDEEVLDENGETIIVQIPPTISEAVEAAEAVAPTNRTGGSKGGGKAEEDEDGEAETERGTSPVQVDPKAVEAASGPTAAIVQQQAEALSADPVLVKAAMLAALRLAETHGISVVQAVLSAAAAPLPSDVDPTPTAEDEKAAEAEAEKAAA
jgi:hypothetical protein